MYGRPPPGANVTSPVSIGIGAPKNQDTLPQLLPQSKLYIPQTRNIPAEQLWDERCKCVPNGQQWGAAWLDRVPTEPGHVYEHFVIVPLRVFTTHSKAAKFERRLKRNARYKDRPLMVFQLGQWLALPVPVWLKDDDSRVAYNRAAIVSLITNDTRSTNIKHEVIRRRQKENAELLRKADEILQPTYETADSSVSQRGPQHALPAGHVRYHTSDEETALLEARGERYELPHPDAVAESAWQKPHSLLSSKHTYGLMWVLPDIQSPGQEFEHVCFAWLGAYATQQHVDDAQRLIKAAHPEWSVVSFEIGTPLQMPIPSWIMQVNSSYVYDQDTLNQLMMRDNAYRSPECVDALIKSRKADTAIDADVLNRIAPRDEQKLDALFDEDKEDIPVGEVLMHQQTNTSDNKKFSLTVTQFTEI